MYLRSNIDIHSASACACVIDESMQRNNYILGTKSYAPYAALSLSIVAFMLIPWIICKHTHTRTHILKITFDLGISFHLLRLYLICVFLPYNSF